MQTATHPSAGGSASLSVSGAARPRLVIVDDDPKILELLKEGLGDDYDVRCAASPLDGLRLIEDVAPSAVILDIAMEGLDGFTICEMIREASWVHYIPIVFLTAHGSPAFASNARSSGGDAFLTKPFSFADLTATLERLRGANAPN